MTFSYFLIRKRTRGRRFHSEEEFDVAINAIFSAIQEMNNLRHFKCLSQKNRPQKCIDAREYYSEHS